MHKFFLWQTSGVSIEMPDSSEELEKNPSNCGGQVREDSEYVRLVIPNESRMPEAGALESSRQERNSSHLWWLKATIWFSGIIIVLLIFVKWGVPFLVEKVLLATLYFPTS